MNTEIVSPAEAIAISLNNAGMGLMLVNPELSHLVHRAADLLREQKAQLADIEQLCLKAEFSRTVQKLYARPDQPAAQTVAPAVVAARIEELDRIALGPHADNYRDLAASTADMLRALAVQQPAAQTVAPAAELPRSTEPGYVKAIQQVANTPASQQPAAQVVCKHCLPIVGAELAARCASQHNMIDAFNGDAPMPEPATLATVAAPQEPRHD